MAEVTRHVVMAGASLRLAGGVVAVIRAYREQGLFDRGPVIYLDTYRGKGLWMQVRTMIAALARLLGLLLRRQVALLHVHSAARGSFWRKAALCAVCRATGVPYVFHLHSGEFARFFAHECGPLGRRWVRTTLHGAACVPVLTPQAQVEISAIAPRARLVVLPNPVTIPARSFALRNTGSRVLFLGRLRRTKGVYDLIEALPAVRKACPGLRVVLAGDGELAEVAAAAERETVADRVELPGWLEGPAKDAAMAAADVVVLPSHYEGLPICVLEAMASGIPVVATAVGGVPFALQDGQCGELVAAGDPAALAAALIRALSDSQRRHRFAAAGRARAQDLFSPECIARQVESCWQMALSGGPHG